MMRSAIDDLCLGGGGCDMMRRIVEEYEIYYDDMKIYMRFVDGILSYLSLTNSENMIDVSIPKTNPEPYEPLIDSILDYLEERLQGKEPNYYTHKVVCEEIIKKNNKAGSTLDEW